MKKKYTTPATHLQTVAPVTVIAGSPDSLNVNSSGSKVNKEDAWSKESGSWGDIWDSDDDE